MSVTNERKGVGKFWWCYNDCYSSSVVYSHLIGRLVCLNCSAVEGDGVSE